MLEIANLETGYGKKQVLFGFSAEVQAGEIVALIGPNGAGKSTVLKAVCGLLPVWKGEIRFEGKSTNGATPAQNVRRGVTYAPQGNRVFAEMTVKENLEIGGFHLSKAERIARVDETLAVFPILRERFPQSAGKLSGGEQQMLALARALVPKPKLLLLDEPSLGLSPKVVGEVFEKITEICSETGVAVFVVEQKVREVLRICHRVYSTKLGRVAFSGTPETLIQDTEKLKMLFI